MKHHAFSAAMGLLLAAAVIAPSQSQAASADPTGIWRKSEQGERPGKMEVFWCGRSKKLLCAKIVWLQQPLDSRGRPLHDIRNEDPSMRDRPIMGLPIFSGLSPTGPATWTGKIYNPEDGNTYSATLTLVSRNQINLKGCKAWLLCGERTWLRTALPKPEPEPEEQIEASAEPEAAAVKPASAEASPPPSAKAAAEPQTEEPSPEESPLVNAEMLTPATPPSEQDTSQGYRFLNVSNDSKTSTGLSGESVPSMFVMTTPIASEADSTPSEVKSSEAPAAGTAAPQEAAAPATQQAAVEPAPAPQPKPKAKPAMQANVATTPKPQAAPAATTPQAEATTQVESEAGLPVETETAETAAIDEQPLSRRQKRLLRRQQLQEGQPQPFLPWLR